MQRGEGEEKVVARDGHRGVNETKEGRGRVILVVECGAVATEAEEEVGFIDARS